ncbi:hypothetical protein [Avibacterium paragallinarum]|uniref:hypothetical protein n=1 Tax=Avibacterium paragallinarum TaxID=728 RepID=UPI0039865ACF
MPCSRNHLSDKTGGRMRPPLFFAEKRLKTHRTFIVACFQHHRALLIPLLCYIVFEQKR